MNDVRYWCTACDAEYIVLPRGGSCLDCDSPLVDEHGTQVEPVVVVEAGDVALIEEMETALAPFETVNPWLKRLFAHPAFGVVPVGAPAVFRAVSPDPEERLVAAIGVAHGLLSVGYLVMTTECLRWVTTAPVRRDDAWSYEYKIGLTRGPLLSGVIVTADGSQFQTRMGKAKAFNACYWIMQQAAVWSAAHETAPPSARGADLAEQLATLADLHRGGALTDEEFAQAKARLLR